MSRQDSSENLIQAKHALRAYFDKWSCKMTNYNIPEDNTVLILDDDAPFRKRLGRALESRGFKVMLAENVS